MSCDAQISRRAYLTYLACRIAQANPASEGTARTGPIGFIEATLFQWINPKGLGDRDRSAWRLNHRRRRHAVTERGDCRNTLGGVLLVGRHVGRIRSGDRSLSPSSPGAPGPQLVDGRPVVDSAHFRLWLTMPAVLVVSGLML